MAKDKKSFILYTDLINTVSKLPDQKAGKLFKLILEYVNDLNPQVNDLILEVAFEPIKQQLKRDLKRWEGYIDKQVQNGKKGGRPKNPEEPNETQKTQAFFEEPKKADNVNVTVNVNDNVKENTVPPANLVSSNLFRKPKIPTEQQVLEAFINSGGTKEMSEAFYSKHQATGWYLNNSPIINYSSLIGKFIKNWNGNQSKSVGWESGLTEEQIKFRKAFG